MTARLISSNENELTEIHHVKDPPLPSFRYNPQDLSLGIDRHSSTQTDPLQTRPVVFYENQFSQLLLPKLQMAVNGDCNEKVGLGSEERVREGGTVHVGFRVSGGGWEV